MSVLAGAVLPEVRHDDHEFPRLNQQDHCRHRGEALNDLGQQPQRVGLPPGLAALPERVSQLGGAPLGGGGGEHFVIRQGADGERYGHLLFAVADARCTEL